MNKSKTPVQIQGNPANANNTKTPPTKMSGGPAKTSGLFHGNHGGNEQSSQYSDVNQNSHARNHTTKNLPKKGY